MKLKYDKELNIATTKSRYDKKYKNTKIKYSELLDKLKEPTRTYELYKDYLKMTKDRQGQIKDVGGFVGGILKDGFRKNENVESRSLLTLDIDYAQQDTWEDIEMTCNFAIACYSTHKHSDSRPRLRLIIPLDRNVSPDEYEAVARKIADEIGMDLFDDTTYQPARLMYWPSAAKDGDWFFNYIDAPFLRADEILESYHDWKDTSFWPISSRETVVHKKEKDRQGDPLEKGGIVGAFCRAYTIQEAIANFIPEEYIETKNGRYTYTKGSTSAGLAIYDDKFAYSNHSTDPVSQQLVNAFDLVRIHKFQHLDDDVKEGTPINRIPSFKAMTELALKDPGVKKEMSEELKSQIKEDFGELPEEDSDLSYIDSLEVDNKQNIIASIDNFLMIIKHDPKLKGIGGLNEFNGLSEVLNPNLPWQRSGSQAWSDNDAAALRHYIEKMYHVEGRQKIEDALAIAFTEKAFHPVRDYLDSVEWDGKERLDTLLIDYLGAEDTEYVREVTRKTLTAAVARIYTPGIKFDQMLTMIGPQGMGKSTLFNILAGEWFSDSLTAVSGKEAYEALDGVWIMEIPELGAMKKAEREQIKMYLSKKVDTYRKAYARYTTVNKRQCIFIGTTNDQEPLEDTTGNRRFWLVECNEERATKSMWDDLTREEINQIWAEAKHRYEKGENIMLLSSEARKEAAELQQAHSESNSMIGLIDEYLKKKIPADWNKRTIEQQQQWYNATEDYQADSDEELQEREYVCAVEIWCVLMGKSKADLTSNRMGKRINECIGSIPGWIREKTPRRAGAYGNQRCFIRKTKN